MHQIAIADRDNQIRGIHYENVGLQDEMQTKYQQKPALQSQNEGYLSNEDKNNDVTILTKSNEAAEYSYISICGQRRVACA